MSACETVSEAWGELTRRHACDSAAARCVLDELVHAYAEPHRHYQTLNHVGDLLHLMREHGGGALDGDALQLAILFHDAVYDPARGDNEAVSAELARVRLTALGFPGELVAKVERYIRATQHGASYPADDTDVRLLLDLDLSVLASSPDRYRAYAEAIRHEYANISDELYRRGRRRVLEGFIARRQIYLTERLHALWETPARLNLAGEMAALM